MFKTGAFREARLSCERIVFNNSEDTLLRQQVLLKKARSFKRQQQYKKGLHTLRRINNIRDSALKEHVFFERVLLAYLHGEYKRGYNSLEFYQSQRNSVLSRRMIFMKILILNKLRKWEKAKLTLKEYVSEIRGTIKVDSLYKEQPDLLDVKKAKNLSYYFLGAGMIYTGDPGQFAASFLLQTGSLAFTIYNVVNGFYVTGLTYGTGLFQKFYLGGVKNSAFLAKKENELRAKEFNKKIKAFLIQAEKGEIWSDH